jgi:hypothetical protein
MKMHYIYVDRYFYSDFKIKEFIQPLKDIIKNSDDINQRYALEHFTILLLKTFIDRGNIKLDDSTPLIQEFTNFIQNNYNLIQPLYQSINDIIGALFLRRSLSKDLLNIIASKDKSKELLSLLPVLAPTGKTNNQEKVANRQRLAIMELYSLVPDFKTNKDQNIQRLYALINSSTIYKSSPIVLNLLLDLMHSVVDAGISQDLKLQLLKVCLPNNRIKNNKEYNQELCLNLSKLQLILAYAHQDVGYGEKNDEYKQYAQDNLPNIKSKSELYKSYKTCANNILLKTKENKLNHIINNNKAYDTIPQLLNYIAGMQNRLSSYVRHDEEVSDLDMFNNAMNKLLNILINDNEKQASTDYNKLRYDAKSSKLVAHLEKNYPQVLKKWQINETATSKDGKVSFINSDSLKDLLEMTKNRCLDVRFSGSGNNMATPSLLINPQYKVCAIVDNKTGEILEFYRERLVLDKKTKQPIIYNGRTMANKKSSDEHVKEFQEFKQKHWQNMGVMVVIEGGTEKNKQTPEVTGLKPHANALVIPPSEIAPFDYIDDSVNRMYKTNAEYVFPESSTHVLFKPKELQVR